MCHDVPPYFMSSKSVQCLHSSHQFTHFDIRTGLSRLPKFIHKLDLQLGVQNVSIMKSSHWFSKRIVAVRLYNCLEIKPWSFI